MQLQLTSVTCLSTHEAGKSCLVWRSISQIHCDNSAMTHSGSKITNRLHYWGRCKSWTLDSGLDHGLDYGLEYGLNSRLIFKLLAIYGSKPGLGLGAVLGLGTTQESPQQQLADLSGNLVLPSAA